LACGECGGYGLSVPSTGGRVEDVTQEEVVGGLYVMWKGNPGLTMGKLVETFVGAEGFTLSDIPDQEWPVRTWRFCPFCGSEDPARCMDLDNQEGCLRELWE
jgi:hypothetical protein